MENRFGLKDFFLFALVGLVLVAVGITSCQSNRQWDRVVNMEGQNRQLATDLNQLGQKIDAVASAGGASAGGTGGGQGPAGGTQIVQNFYGVGATPQAGGGQTAMPNAAPAAVAEASGSPTTGPAVDASEAPSVADTGEAFELLAEAEAEPDFARGGWYLDNFGTKIGRLTPLVSSDVYASWIQALVVEGMAQRDPYTLEFEPKLAESWDVSEDGLTMTFTLRDGLRFSDGQPLTAEDVKWTFDWIRNPEVQAERDRSALTKLGTVEALDARRVRFTFTGPYYLNFEVAAGTGILPKHFYKGYTPPQFNESIGLLMGSGQYMLQSPTDWTPAQDVTLVRNPRYWGPKATFDRMNFKQIQEEAAQEVMFRNGDLDRFAPPPENFDKLKADPAIERMAEAFNYDSPFNGYRYIGWNQEKRVDGNAQPTIFADARVRRAMTMLVNRQRIVDELLRGYARVASGPFAPTSPQSDPDVQPYPYDVSAAMDLLAEAGWKDRDGDGVLENEKGEPLRFKLMYPGGNEFFEKLALALQDDFAQGKVYMEPERTDWPVLVDRLNKSDFEAATLGWSGSVESDPYQIFSSAQAMPGGDNRTGYRSAALDDAINAARVTMDTDERMELWHKVHRILHEDQPYTFLFNSQALRLMNDRLHNVEESPLGLNYEFLNGGVLPWFIPAGRQERTN